MNNCAVQSLRRHILARSNKDLRIKSLGALRVRYDHVLAETPGIFRRWYGEVAGGLWRRHNSRLLSQGETGLRPFFQRTHEDRYFLLTQSLQHDKRQGRLFGQAGETGSEESNGL